MSFFEFTTSETPTMVNLDQYLSYLTIERVAELEMKVIRHDPNYQQIQAELEACYHEIQRLLPDSHRIKKITDELQVKIGLLEVLIGRLAYRHGLKDGATFLKQLMD